MKNKSPITLRIVSVILLIGWMGLIFCFSHQNSSDSSNLSTLFIKSILKISSPELSATAMENMVASFSFFVRKTAHFFLYFVLGILSFTSFSTYNSLSLAIRCYFSLSLSVIYSASDEYHQTFVVGRSGELRDVLIDSLGALTGIILSLIIYKIHKAIKAKGPRKMKKKQYIELTEMLSQRLNTEKQLSQELKQENSALNEELLILRGKIADLENKIITPKEEPAITETVPEKTEETAASEPELSCGITDGARVIGKIVLSSAEYCNRLTEIGASANAKELVNLILGRTEVAKGEILRLSSLDISPKERLDAMEREFNDAEDYFKSVMAQKTP